MSTTPEAQQVNPIVRKAADQIAESKRVGKPKPKDPPRYQCRGQLSLFDTTEVLK